MSPYLWHREALVLALGCLGLCCHFLAARLRCQAGSGCYRWRRMDCFWAHTAWLLAVAPVPDALYPSQPWRPRSQTKVSGGPANEATARWRSPRPQASASLSCHLGRAPTHRPLHRQQQGPKKACRPLSQYSGFSPALALAACPALSYVCAALSLAWAPVAFAVCLCQGVAPLIAQARQGAPLRC